MYKSMSKAGRTVTKPAEEQLFWPGTLGRALWRKGELRGEGWRSVMMMLRCSAAAKMDWPKLGLIKSQGWLRSSADIINIEMIMVEPFGLTNSH